jgi:hypothetical protein
MNNAVDERAERWRTDQWVQKELNRQAKRDQLMRRSRRISTSIRFSQPAWQRWVIYPIGFWILWRCIHVVLLGAPIR